MNDGVRWGLCALIGFILALAYFKLRGRPKADLHRFAGGSLGGAALGTFAGMLLAGVGDLSDLPFSNWWLPILAATLLAILLPLAVEDPAKPRR